MRLSALMLVLALAAASPAAAQDYPSPPQQTSKLGDLLDSMFTGGAFAARRDRIAAEQELAAWKAEMAELMAPLSPAQRLEVEPFYQDALRKKEAELAHRLQGTPRASGYVGGGDNCIGAVVNGVCHGTRTDGTAGRPVHSARECIGSYINGVCHGAAAPAARTCHGQMLNGRCTGPMF